MKSIFPFIKTTIYGGILFLIPFTIIIIVLNNIYTKLYKMVAPIAVSIGVENLGGKLAVILLVIIILIILCFLAGLILRIGIGKRFHEKIENLALKFIPGYDKLKADTLKSVDKNLKGKVVNVYDNWQSVFLKYSIDWKIAFIIEESEEGLVTIFEPGSPEFLKGTTKIISKKDMISIPVDKEKAISYLKRYGTGVSELLKKSDLVSGGQVDSMNKNELNKERVTERDRDRGRDRERDKVTD